MTRRSSRATRSLVAARSKTARRGLSSAELRVLRRGHRTRNSPGTLHPAPLIVAAASAIAVIGAWVLLVIVPAVPDFDDFTAVAALVLGAGYLFQICWAVYLLPVAPLYTRLTITGHTPPRHSWALWVLPAIVPILVLAVITPATIPTESFEPDLPVPGVLALHLLIFVIVGLAAVVVWMVVVAPIGLFAASLLPHRSPGASVFGALTTADQRWTAAIPVSMVGFAVSLASVSDRGRSRLDRMAHDLRELISLTGEPWAIAGTWVFVGLVVFFVVRLGRSRTRAPG